MLVLGDVKTPGKYQLRSDAKLTDAIAAAGGIVNANGAFPDARVADANGTVTVVSLEALLQRGDTSLDTQLERGFRRLRTGAYSLHRRRFRRRRSSR